MTTSFKTPNGWQHGLVFFGVSFLLLVISLVFALWGVSVGSSFLQQFNAGSLPQLGTMGEILGGTMAFAVAFAGAWVAFKIAARANVIVGLQQAREASRDMHRTLEKSIGQILAIQLELEALLREVGTLAMEVHEIETDWKTQPVKKAAQPTEGHTMNRANPHEQKASSIAQQIMEEVCKIATQGAAERASYLADRVLAQAEKVSEKMQKLLNNPLAIAAVLEVSRAKNPKVEEREILTELAQVPRLLDTASYWLRARRHVREKSARWMSPYDFARMFLPEQLWDLGLGDLLVHKPGDAELVNELSYLCFLTGECDQGPVNSEIKEPSLWRALRVFVYTPSQAEAALKALCPPNIYSNPKIRSELLQSEAAQAFALSGMTNDLRIAQKLRDCQRITESIRAAVKRPECKQYTPPAVLSLLQGADLGFEPALTRAERLWNDLPKYGDGRPSVRPVCSGLYAMLVSRFYHMSKSSWFQLPPFELYQCIVKTFRDYKTGVAPQAFSVTSLLGDISRDVDVLAAQGKLHKKVGVDRTDLNDNGAIRQGVNRLAALAVQAAAADLLDGLEIPQDPALDELNLFAELQKGLNKRIVDRALGPLSSAQEADVGRLLKEQAVTPLQVQLAAQACAAQSGAGEFETWLINQLRSAVTHQMQCVLCLAEVQALGGSGRVEPNEKEFMVICEKLRDVPDFLASSVTISSEAETEKFVSVEFRLPWFDEAGFAKVPHADLKLTQLMLLCGMLGYLKVDPREKFSGAYRKSVRWGINDLHWLRLVILELKLLGTIYGEMAGEPDARDAEVTHL